MMTVCGIFTLKSRRSVSIVEAPTERRHQLLCGPCSFVGCPCPYNERNAADWRVAAVATVIPAISHSAWLSPAAK